MRINLYRIVGCFRRLLLPGLIVVAGGVRGADLVAPPETPRVDRWVPFHLPWESPEGSLTDARFLLDPPAGKHGPITVRDGHFVFADGKRMRFWGMNISGGENFPERESAVRTADRLARFGFNLVRLHGLDSNWGRTLLPRNAPDSQQFDAVQLEKLDYFIAELEKRGIYINLNLHVARQFTPADGVKESDRLGFAKYSAIFNPRLIELQKDYARQLFGHRNPFTGHTYAEDPAVIICELTNEDSLFGGWSNGFLRGQQNTVPAGGGWSDIPPAYGVELTRLFNDWLRERYPTREALQSAWQTGSRAAGPTMLRNGDFGNHAAGWSLSHPQWGAFGALEAVDEGPEKKACAKVTVSQVDDSPWHVMLTHRPLALRKEMRYQVRFRARASEVRQMNVEVCNSTPYRGYGNARFELDDRWREFEFNFTAPEEADNARLSFQLGESKGTVWVADATLQEAPVFGLRAHEDPREGSVTRLDPKEFASATTTRFRDEGRFLLELERRYYETMRLFLRDTLKVKALIEGTNENYGLPSLWNQSQLDLMDCHAYWQHPSFPRQPWSKTDWTIENSPMLNTPQLSTISALSRSAVQGKPMTVSEYNHPFPSEYGCEMPLLLAAYASLQDWDAVYSYTLGRELGGNRVGGYFDICNEVSKMAQMPAAAMLFLRGEVQPARRLVTISYDQNRLFDSLRLPRWDRVHFYTDGELSPLLPLVHRLRVERFDAPQTTCAAEVEFKEPLGRIQSDTGELLWEDINADGGRLTINTPRLQAAVGRLGDLTLRSSGVEFQLKTRFCAVSLAALDGQPLSRSKRILLVAVARCMNSGMEWDEKRKSLGDRWGKAPLLVEPVEGELVLKRDPDCTDLTLTPLDGRGVPENDRVTALAKQGGDVLIQLPATTSTVWYILRQP